MIQVLGSPTAEADSVYVPLPLRRSRTRLVFAALVLVRRELVTRGAIARLIWPDEAPAEGLARLRRALHEISAALQGLGRRQPLLVGAHGQIQLNPAAVQLDVDDFFAAVTAVAQHAHATLVDCAACRERLTAALTLYRGPLLASYEGGAGEDFEQRLSEQRSELELHFGRALEQLMRQQVAAGNWPAATLSADRLLAVNPYAETAVRVRLEAFAREGAFNQARRAFAHFRQRLRDDLGHEPDVATLTLLARINTGQLSLPAAPAPAVQLIGRERLISHIEQQIVSGRQRLTSLVGVGGSGKTALAQLLAQRLAAHFSGNCHTIMLAEFRAAAQLWPALLRLSGINDQLSSADAEQTVRLLDQVPCLIVLDNAEHLPDLAEQVRLLLRRTTRLTVILTSLRPLAIGDEWVVPLEGLSLPAQDWNGEGAWPAAVELFVQQAGPHLSPPTAADLQRIGRITAAVSGLPLGVLLAAAQLSTRSLDDVYRMLVVEHQLPAVPLAHLDERHHSLARVIDMLWDAMTELERSVLTQAAAFAAAFDLAAAHAVIRLPAGHSEDLRELLYAAADRTLLRMHNRQRFAWHALLHRDARRRLAMRPDADAVMRRHADYQLQSIADNGVAGVRQVVSPPDLREAWLRLCTSGDRDVVRAQAIALATRLYNLTHYALAAELLEAAATAISNHAPLEAQRLRAEAVIMRHYAADYAHAWPMADQLTADTASHDDPIIAHRLGQLQVMRAFHEGRLREAETITEQLEQRLAAHLPADELVRLLNLRLQASFLRDNHRGAIQIGEQLSQLVGFAQPAARYFSAIVAVSRLMADNDAHAAAQDLLSTVRRDLRIDGQPHWIVTALERLLAGAAVIAAPDPFSDPEQPVSVYESGTAMALGVIQQRCGALDAARASLEQALATSSVLRSAWGRGAILINYSHTVRQLGDQPRAIDAAQLAVDVCELHCDRRLVAAAYCALGYALLGTDPAAAATALHHAEVLARQMDLPVIVRDTALAQAGLAQQQGRPHEAARLLAALEWTPNDWWHSPIASESAWLLISLLEELDPPRAAALRDRWLTELDRVAGRLSPQQRPAWHNLDAHDAVRQRRPYPFPVPA